MMDGRVEEKVGVYGNIHGQFVQKWKTEQMFMHVHPMVSRVFLSGGMGRSPHTQTKQAT